MPERKALSRSDQGKKEVSGSEEGPDTTATLQPLAEADPDQWLSPNITPHVFLSVPNLGVDRIKLVVEDVEAQVQLKAKVLDLVELEVGVWVGIKKVDLEIDNVRVQAMLQVDLEPVRDIVGDVVGLIKEHPEILTNLTEGLGKGLEGGASDGDSGGAGEIAGPEGDDESEDEAR